MALGIPRSIMTLKYDSIHLFLCCFIFVFSVLSKMFLCLFSMMVHVDFKVSITRSTPGLGPAFLSCPGLLLLA